MISKKLIASLVLLISAAPVEAAVFEYVGISFRNLFSNSNFLFFFFFLLVFALLYFMVNGGAKYIPMFKDNAYARKAFSIVLSLIVTTTLFLNYRGTVLGTITDTLGPVGMWILYILLGAIILWFLIRGASKVKGEGKGSALWFIIIGIIVIIVLFLIASLSGGAKGGVGLMHSGDMSDWIKFAIGLLLLLLLMYGIYRGLKAGGLGGLGTGGGKAREPKVKKEKPPKAPKEQKSKWYNPATWFRKKGADEKAAAKKRVSDVKVDFGDDLIAGDEGPIAGERGAEEAT